MFRVQSGHWDKLEQDAKFIRKQVFIIEQNIPEEEEWDDQDMISDHFVVYDQDQPIATARLLQNNSVGRVAVLKAYRGQGIGRMIMLEIIRQAHQQDRKPVGRAHRRRGRRRAEPGHGRHRLRAVRQQLRPARLRVAGVRTLILTKILTNFRPTGILP